LSFPRLHQQILRVHCNRYSAHVKTGTS
jgi:hypothetical protein